MSDIRFGFQAAAAGEGVHSDQTLYKDMLDDCTLGASLGYDAAWLLEHHFSDYYPTPSPLLAMAYIAATCPDLSLGTSVLVLPWYHPLRLAEEIAMLNSLTRGTLHLGIGRGTARMEYDAYNVDMNEARARFAEVFRIVEQVLDDLGGLEAGLVAGGDDVAERQVLGPAAIEQRFGGVVDSIDMHLPPGTPAGLAKELVTDIKRIPHTFAGFNTNW